MNNYSVLIGFFCFIAGFAIAYWVSRKVISQKAKSAEIEAKQILTNAGHKAETMLKEADLKVKDKLFTINNFF